MRISALSLILLFLLSSVFYLIFFCFLCRSDPGPLCSAFCSLAQLSCTNHVWKKRARGAISVTGWHWVILIIVCCLAAGLISETTELHEGERMFEYFRGKLFKTSYLHTETCGLNLSCSRGTTFIITNGLGAVIPV